MTLEEHWRTRLIAVDAQLLSPDPLDAGYLRIESRLLHFLLHVYGDRASRIELREGKPGAPASTLNLHFHGRHLRARTGSEIREILLRISEVHPGFSWIETILACKPGVDPVKTALLVLYDLAVVLAIFYFATRMLLH